MQLVETVCISYNHGDGHGLAPGPHYKFNLLPLLPEVQRQLGPEFTVAKIVFEGKFDPKRTYRLMSYDRFNGIVTFTPDDPKDSQTASDMINQHQRSLFGHH
jgi:hypothetical protein